MGEIKIYISISGEVKNIEYQNYPVDQHNLQERNVWSVCLDFENSNIMHAALIFVFEGKLYFYESYGQYTKRGQYYGLSVCKYFGNGMRLYFLENIGPQSILLKKNNEAGANLPGWVEHDDVDKNIWMLYDFEKKKTEHNLRMFNKYVTKNCVMLCLCDLYLIFSEGTDLLGEFGGNLTNEIVRELLWKKIIPQFEHAEMIVNYLLPEMASKMALM